MPAPTPPTDPCPRPAVPIWVPDPGDPNGLEDSWLFVHADSTDLDPRQTAQAEAVSALWSALPAA